MIISSDLNIEEWVNSKLMRGKNAFSLDELRIDYPNQTEVALKYALIRLSGKGKILSIHKGYYLIITPQYASKGVLPPTLFLDGLMKYLGRPYYISLLNAAVFHGSSHQAPQEFFVVTTFPVLRPTAKKGIKINYISRKEINVSLLETRQTESGYLLLSNPILTAADLVQFEKRVGGLTRVANILYDFIDQIKPESVTKELIEYVHITTIQRLGYLLDEVIKSTTLADTLYFALTDYTTRIRPVVLKASLPTKSLFTDNRWRVVVNTDIDLEV